MLSSWVTFTITLSLSNFAFSSRLAMFSTWVVRADNTAGRQSPAVKRHTLLQNNSKASFRERRKHPRGVKLLWHHILGVFGVLVMVIGQWPLSFLDPLSSPYDSKLMLCQKFYFPENPSQANRCHVCPPVCKSRYGQVKKLSIFITCSSAYLLLIPLNVGNSPQRVVAPIPLFFSSGRVTSSTTHCTLQMNRR